MDSYVSKPVKYETLSRKIDNLLFPDKLSGVTLLFNVDYALRMVSGNRELLSEGTKLFIELDYPRYISILKGAIENLDSATVSTAAQGIKGAAVNLGGKSISALAARLESTGKEITAIPRCDLLNRPFGRRASAPSLPLTGLKDWKEQAARSRGLIIPDTVLPGIDGCRVFRELQNNPATGIVPMLFLSADRETDENRIKSKRVYGCKVFTARAEKRTANRPAVAFDYLLKPISAKEPVARVREKLDTPKDGGKSKG